VVARRRIDLSGSSWDVEVELGAQLRVFVVPNVALIGSLGLAMYFPDKGTTEISVAGNLLGTIGVAYYFM